MRTGPMTAEGFAFGLLNNVEYFVDTEYRNINSLRFEPQPPTEFLGSIIKLGGGFQRRVYRWLFSEGLTIIFLSNGETSIFRIESELLTSVTEKGFRTPVFSAYEMEKLATIYQEKPYKTVEKEQGEQTVIRYLYDCKNNLNAIEAGCQDRMFYESRILLETDKIKTAWI